tara:strand:- start:1015 stop:1173 length:159 start_codon:yes stop_codon:yes gene_type:complete
MTNEEEDEPIRKFKTITKPIKKMDSNVISGEELKCMLHGFQEIVEVIEEKDD